MSPLGVESRTILLVEDNAGDAGLIEALLEDSAVPPDRIVHVETLRQAVADRRVQAADVVLLDLKLPDGFGVECVLAVRASAPDVPIVVLTGIEDQQLALECIAAGAQDYLAKDEVRAQNLRRALNHAIARMREETERRRADALQERHAAIVEASTDAIVSSTLEGIVTSWNRGAELIFGYSRDEAIGRPAAEVMRPAGNGGAPASAAAQVLVLQPQESAGEARELVRLRKDGTPVTLSVVSCNLRGASGRVVALAAICRDVTEARQRDDELKRRNRQLVRLLDDISALANRLGLEELGVASAPVRNAPPDAAISQQALDGVLAPFEAAFRAFVEANRRLAAQNRELSDAKTAVEASNRELEAFSYSVAHDLRTPLAGIDGFSQLLQRTNGEHLDERGRLYLASIFESTHRMDNLIDDLLKLSQVTRAELRRMAIDLVPIARGIAARLQEEQPQRAVDFAFAEHLPVEADRNLVQIALENLLRNAHKFTAGREPARIELGLLPDGAEPVYFVRDNGVGFDPALAHRLFGAFQRLHSQAEFTGTGIGLSIVRRIVERHGGRVWAEGGPDAGATFLFTLK